MSDSAGSNRVDGGVWLRPDDVSVRRFYEAMVAVITPRPIAWISTVNAAGAANLAPYSFFNGVGANPPTVMFCPALKPDGTPKDSLANVQATGEFVVNIVTEPFAEAMKLTAAESDAECDEFEMAELPKADSALVRPPRVAGAAAAIECRLHTALQLGTGPGGANLVIGRILAIYLAEESLSDGRPDPERIATIGRMGGPRYTYTRERFE